MPAYVPLRQLEHADALSAAYVPRGQLEHTAAPVVANLPETQVSHAELPVLRWNVARAHAVHELAEAAE